MAKVGDKNANLYRDRSQKQDIKKGKAILLYKFAFAKAKNIKKITSFARQKQTLKQQLMSIIDLYESAEHRNHLGHFAAIVNIAAVDGAINEEEITLIKRFARKLDITNSEYEMVLKAPANYPIQPPTSAARRLERIYDLFKIVYIDHNIDEPELQLVNRYATGLGFSEEQAESLIEKSMKIFGGGIEFEDYKYLVSK